MPPHNTNNKSCGISGRAVSGTASRCDAARAGNARNLAHGLAVVACAVTVLVLKAPDLWPQLFP
jgi:hypothetical protein